MNRAEQLDAFNARMIENLRWLAEEGRREREEEIQRMEMSLALKKAVKRYTSMSDKVDMGNKSQPVGIEEHPLGGWAEVASSVLDTIYTNTNNTTLNDFPDDLRELFPHFGIICDLLLQEGFVRKLDLQEGGFPYKLTFKGLILYSVLGAGEHHPHYASNFLRLLELPVGQRGCHD